MEGGAPPIVREAPPGSGGLGLVAVGDVRTTAHAARADHVDLAVAFLDDLPSGRDVLRDEAAALLLSLDVGDCPPPGVRVPLVGGEVARLTVGPHEVEQPAERLALALLLDALPGFPVGHFVDDDALLIGGGRPLVYH